MTDTKLKRGNCHTCGRDMYDAETLIYEEVTGWRKKRRTTGGTNTVALARETGRLMCYMCINKAKRGLIQQESLL